MSDDDDDDIREFSNHDDYASENVTKKYICVYQLFLLFICFFFSHSNKNKTLQKVLIKI